MKNNITLAILLVCLIFHVQPALSQSTEEIEIMKKDIQTLKDGQTAIQKELQDIKKQLRARQAPPEFKEAVIRVDGNHFKGDKNAKLALIEFSDYQ